MAFFFRSAASCSYVFAFAANWLANPPLPPVVVGLKPPLALVVLVVGLKPPLALDVLVVGLKAFAENVLCDVLISLLGVNWKPVDGAAGFDGSGAGVAAALGENRLLDVDVEGDCGLLLIA